MRRGIVATGVVLLALVSARGLQLHYAPALSLPELMVRLTMPPAAATDPIETTSRWIVPVESAIRSLGDVVAMRGEIAADGATLTVRFRRGTDAELKVARLASELAGLRARLPRDAALSVWPSQQNGARPSAFLAFSGSPERARRVADELRTVSGAREVEVYGGVDVEREVRIARGQRLTAEELIDAIVPHHLGTVRSGSRLVAVDAFGTPLDRAVEKSAPGAFVSSRLSRPVTMSRMGGRPVVMLSVLRDDDVSLFDFDAALREKARAHGLEEVWSEAAEMRTLLMRLAIGALIASIVLAIGGVLVAGRPGLVLGAYIPLAVAIAVNVARIAAARVDVFTLLVAAVAIAGVIPFAASRVVWRRAEWWPAIVTVVFFCLLPIATALGSGNLAPLLAAPSRAFAVSGIAAVLAALMIPVGRVPRVAPAGSVTRRLLRDSAGVVLASVAAACVLLAWFGARLDPRRAGETIERGRLYIRIALPAGTTLAATADSVGKVEQSLRELDDIARFWSVVAPGRASIVLELTPEAQSTARMQLLRIRLQSVARLAPGSVTVSESLESGGGRFSSDLEDRPEADEDGHIYRVLIKSTDADVLGRVHDDLATRLTRIGVRRAAVQPEWAASTTRLELVPRADVSPELASEAAADIARQTLPARGRAMPDGRVLRVVADGTPQTIDDVPQRADVFSRTYAGRTIPALFTPGTRVVIGRLTRELGRFVLPVTVRVPGWGEEKLARREEIDRITSLVAPPAGTIIDRPSLSRWTFSAAKLRLLGLAAFLPVLLIAAATVILNSFARAALATAPSILGVSVAAPLLLLTGSEVDEITLVGLAAAVCCTVPATVIAIVRSGSTTGRAYRAVRQIAVSMIFAAVAIAVMLGTAAGGAAALRSGWRAPMAATAAVLVAATAAGAILPGALLFALRDARRRWRVGKAVAHPAEWRRPDAANTLSVRNVSKTYAGGFRALRQVSFELTPGVIGLLGPNGAGKTTLLRTLTGLLLPTRGQIVFRGVPVTPENLADYRRFVGFLPQEFNAYAGLTAEQFLDYWMVERGLSDGAERAREVERLIALVDLTEHAGRRVRDYSGGMRQRIGIARALIGDPPLVVVDEPTTGLDIEARARFRELMQTLGRERVVILSTHIAGDVEETASRILLIVKGVLRWDGTPDALITRAEGRVFETVASDADARALSRRYRITTRVRTPHGIRLRGVVRADEPLPGNAVQPTLEEAYLAEATEGAVRLGSFSFLAREPSAGVGIEN